MVGGVTVATTAIEVGCGWVVGGWGEGVGLSGRTSLVFPSYSLYFWPVN